MATSTAPGSLPPRKPFRGSCHCGAVKFIAYLNLPANTDDALGPGTRIRKCNCSTCHKMGMFHVRLANAPEDFLLLSPLDLSELGSYKCFTKHSDWYFCKTCGVRPFVTTGQGQRRVVDVPGEGTREVWTHKVNGWDEINDDPARGIMYLSVNATALDAGQEGLDLREWHEKGWIWYLDWLEDDDNLKLQPQVGKPVLGGMY